MDIQQLHLCEFFEPSVLFVISTRPAPQHWKLCKYRRWRSDCSPSQCGAMSKTREKNRIGEIRTSGWCKARRAIRPLLNRLCVFMR